jgi:hypothetical protein
VDVVYRERMSVVSVQKGPVYISAVFPGNSLTIQVDLPIAHLGDEALAGDHRHPDALQHDVGVHVKVGLV